MQAQKLKQNTNSCAKSVYAKTAILLAQNRLFCTILKPAHEKINDRTIGIRVHAGAYFLWIQS